MTRKPDKWTVAHVLLGALLGWLCWSIPAAGISGTIVLIGYQALEDYRKKDYSYRDVKEYAVGFLPTATVFGIINTGGVV